MIIFVILFIYDLSMDESILCLFIFNVMFELFKNEFLLAIVLINFLLTYYY